jgi:hypothetical protein
LNRPLAQLALAVLLASPASAAKITVLPDAKRKCSVVRIKGDIKAGDFANFAKAILPLRRAIVELESEGGTIFDGIFIGKLIRGYGFWTTVKSRKTCASACALAWLAGSKRFVEKRGRIGFHSAYQKKGRKLKRDREANQAVGDYIKALGLSEKVVSYATAAAPIDMKWLTPKDARSIGMTVTFGAPPNEAVTTAGATAVSATAAAPVTNAAATAPDRENLCGV